MKKYFGFILLLLSFQCFAKNTTGLLILRAQVPVSHKVEIRLDKNGLHTQIKTNALNGYARPKFYVKKSPDTYMVSVVHP